MSLKLGNIENLCECSDLTTSLDEIKEVESHLNFSFPLELRKIFETCNGGKPIPNTISYKDQIFAINYFFSLTEIKNYKNLYDDESFPNGYQQLDLIPFAYDMGNGTFAISNKPKDCGKVVFFYFEEKAVIYGEWDNFNEFLSSFIDKSQN